MNDNTVSVEFDGTGLEFGAASYEIDHWQDQGHGFIDVTLDIGGLTVTFTFDEADGEDFIYTFRNELVEARRAALEWETAADVGIDAKGGDDGT